MHVYNDLTEVPFNKSTVVTIGTFDGIHLGHKKIIEKVVDRASQNNSRSLLITFYPHPRNVVSGDKIKLLNTQEEKSNLISSLGINDLVVIKFTKEFSQLAPSEFFKNIVVDKIGLTEIIIGHDHHFGKGRGGDQETLKEMGKEFNFEVTAVDAVKISDEIISSTKIRNFLTEGDIKKSNEFLGRYYSFNGSVVEGDKRGRELGFPTANIQLGSNEKLLPALGIYLVEVLIENNRHHGLLSIGRRPTFYNEGSIVPEVFIFEFDQDIYGKNIVVNMIERIREEKKYSSAEALITQMNEDKKIGKKLLKKLNV
jgi:riboflavin kinase / FMN adenylyltransferase